MVPGLNAARYASSRDGWKSFVVPVDTGAGVIGVNPTNGKLIVKLVPVVHTMFPRCVR